MRRTRSSRRTAAGAAAAFVILLSLAGAATLLSARGHLTAAQAAAVSGKDALGNQDVAGAEAAFSDAGSSFQAAEQRLSSVVLRVLDVVPVARKNVQAARASAEAGSLVSLAAAEVIALLGEESGGAAALAPRGGRIPLELLEDAATPVAQASEAIRRAAGLVERADSPWLVGPVAEGVRDLRTELATAERLADVAQALTGHLPAFLGAEGPRRYFFGAANPAELRGAGGFIGAYTIMTAEDGRLAFGDFTPIHDLPNEPVETGRPPTDDYASRYNRYGGAGFWQNINMTRDYPSAAVAIEGLYERMVGDRLDGTVLVNPAALVPLLEVTGPTDIPGIGQVDAETVVAVMANEAFGEFASHDERKRALGAVAAGVFDRFLQGSPQAGPAAAGRALTDAATGGSMLLHAADPDVQQALEAAGVAGELPAPTGDFLAVVGNNAAANKADFYTDRAVTYRASLRPGGTIRSRATVTVRNETPAAGESSHVIGPNLPGLQAGDNRTILDVFCAAGCALREFERNGEAAAPSPERELGHPVFGSLLTLATGESAELDYRWTVPDGWLPDADGGTYRLTVREQATIRPTSFELTIVVPDGLSVAHTSHDMERTDRRLRWAGELSSTEVFEVRLHHPLQRLAADGLRAWATRPLLHDLAR